MLGTAAVLAGAPLILGSGSQELWLQALQPGLAMLLPPSITTGVAHPSPGCFGDSFMSLRGVVSFEVVTS